MSGNAELDIERLLKKLDSIVAASDEVTGPKVTNRSRSFEARGMNSMMYSAEWDNEIVTLKGLKVDRQDALNVKWVLNEVEIWSSLKHEHILELKGICHGVKESGDAEEDSDVTLPGNTKDTYFIFLVSNLQLEGDLAGLFLPSEESDNATREGHVKNRIQTVKWLEQIASALAYMHGEGIVHGDVKLDNVLLSEDEKTKLCDFGHSFRSGLHGDIPQNARWQYCAPELLETGVRTTATDVFAFALLMYEALTGNQAYNVFNSIEEARATVKKERPQWPGTLEGLQPVDAENLHSLVAACWDAQPDARPSMSTVHDLLQNLDLPPDQFKAKLPVHH